MTRAYRPGALVRPPGASAPGSYLPRAGGPGWSRARGRARSRIGLFLVAAALGLSCDRKTGTVQVTGRDKPLIYTTFYPTRYFAERIGGDRAEVVCPVPVGEDAIFWMPEAKVIAAYQKADLIIVNGAGFAKWVDKVSLPQAKIVDTAKPLAKEFIRYEKSTTHSHGPSGAHEHKGIDGHTWVDPVNAKVQAGEIAKAMKKRFPEHAAAFEEGWKSLAKDLDGLHEELDALAKGYGGRPILASHPAYNYIARRYKWSLTSLDLDPEEMPDDDAFAALKDLLKTKPARHLLWEAYPKKEIAERMKKELGIESVEFSPCELLGDEEIASGLDYMKVMKATIENVRKVLAPQK